ncbi:hypothetical protein [Sphaerisporangium dianthi]|uniref:Uncharacterized protein n=1 Tax=Sphaerisporangium dianthi TaxID=1436120 RepID=A0ABV9CRV5_9ACTN
MKAKGTGRRGDRPLFLMTVVWLVSTPFLAGLALLLFVGRVRAGHSPGPDVYEVLLRLVTVAVGAGIPATGLLVALATRRRSYAALFAAGLLVTFIGACAVVLLFVV